LESEVPAVGFARVLAGAKSFKDQGIANLSDTYRGQILIGKSEVRAAIIKDIPLREVANEVLAATLAIAISLPVPPPFIALASPSDLATKYASKLGASSLLFASADVNSPSVAQLVLPQSGQVQMAAMQMVAKSLIDCGWLGELYGFDGWSANVDRHVGNVLIASNRQPWLIDHGRCFTGAAWTAADLDPAKFYRHRLREWLTPLLDDAEQKRLSAAAAAMVPKLSALDVAALGAQNRLPALLGQADFDVLVTFLKDRIGFVPRIAADALNQPRVV
jgi:HipA-like protein